MTIAALVHDALANNTAVSAIVGTRIYPFKLPEHPTLEAISYQRIGNTGVNGSTNLRESRYQFSCWADTYLKTQTLSAAVKATFEGYVSTTNGIKMGLVVNELDDYEDSTQPPTYRVIVDVIFVTEGD